MYSRGPCYYHPGHKSICPVIPHNTPLCTGGEPLGMETNNMDVEGEHYPAAACSAPSTAALTAASTAASTAAAQVQPITSLSQHEETSSTPVVAAAAAAAAGAATGANVAATALAQQTTPLQVCGSSRYR